MQVFCKEVDDMFDSFEQNKAMIVGAYKKLKSYYYYDKTILYNKMRLATWQHGTKEFNQQVDALANFMCSLEGELDTKYLDMLMKQISLIPMPKSFVSLPEDSIIRNTTREDIEVSKINFYIKAPVELLILDTIWALMIGKIIFEQRLFNDDLYANRLNEKKIYNDSSSLYDGIDFSSNRLFKPYFRQYSNWRNNAVKNVRQRYDALQDSLLISLDIKSYYYSVIFDFEKLKDYLNNDSRIDSIISLTNIIRNIYLSYTSEMQKYRGNIPADCKKGQSALPIGLLSSMLIANLYLKDFDDAVRIKIAPSYYGRYVDDIILVVDRTADMDISTGSIFEKLFIKKDLAESKGTSYRLLVPNGELDLQKDKIRCIYFDHSESDAMIKLLYEAGKITASMSEGFLMPDIDPYAKDFDEYAYSAGQISGALKVRDFLFVKNNYSAALRLNDLIRASKGVDISEETFSRYIEKQFKQILEFYNHQHAIEYRSAWITVFTLILVNRRYDYFLRFYHQIHRAINRITSEKVESIKNINLDYILRKTKESLIEHLMVATTIAVSPFALDDLKSAIFDIIQKKQVDYQEYKSEFDIVFSNAIDIRKNNMFNNHNVAFPLLNYVSNIKNNVSLVDINPQEFVAVFGSCKLDQEKLDFAPRFIHLEELYLWMFISKYSEGGNPYVKGMIEYIYSEFTKTNHIEKSDVTIAENEAMPENSFMQGIVAPTFCKSRNNKRFKIALASIYIDEEKDVVPVLKNPHHNLTPSRKAELYTMLNEAKTKGAQFIVFPEFFMPLQWLNEILTFSRKNQIAIIGGLRYLVSGNRAYNYFSVMQPFGSGFYKYSVPLFREKNYYAPAEVIELAREHIDCVDPENKTTHYISWNGLRYSSLMCYELTNIEYRYQMRGLVDLLVVPELNKDTNYFANIVESTTRDLHSFVVQVNTSKYGDSRITGPYNTLFKDIIKLKGGEDNMLLTGSIDVMELEQNRNSYMKEMEEKKKAAWDGTLPTKPPDKRKVKDPSAGYM